VFESGRASGTVRSSTLIPQLAGRPVQRQFNPIAFAAFSHAEAEWLFGLVVARFMSQRILPSTWRYRAKRERRRTQAGRGWQKRARYLIETNRIDRLRQFMRFGLLLAADGLRRMPRRTSRRGLYEQGLVREPSSAPWVSAPGG